MAQREVPGGDVGHLALGGGSVPLTQHGGDDSQVCVQLGLGSLDELRVDPGLTDLNPWMNDISKAEMMMQEKLNPPPPP